MLSIVPTPIGNLRDITLRALETLKHADAVACEDTRHTGKLLSHYEISKPLISFHEHSSERTADNIIERVLAGEKIALVSDAGMPSVSDPGFEIIRKAVLRGAPFEVLPGAQAAVTALVASGLAPDSFVFLGFPPQKPGKRRKEFERVREYPETLIFYESPFRVLKTLQEMNEVFGDREAAVARELTKKFEEILRGRIPELIEGLTKKPPKGEIVIVVSGANRKSLLPAAGAEENDE